MEIPRTKMGCLNASTIQRQCTAQLDLTLENQSQVQSYSAEDSDEESRQVIYAKRQKTNSPPETAEVKLEALDSK